MKKLSEIMGLSLYTIKEGESCGVVDDIIIDPESKQIIYIITNTGSSIFSVSILPYQNVMSIGTSFITAQSKEYFVSLGDCYKQIPSLLSIKDLMKAKVMFISGSNIVNITDMTIDDNGKLHQIIMDDITVSCDSVSTITRDFIFVTDNEELTAKMAEKKIELSNMQSVPNIEIPQPSAPEIPQEEPEHNPQPTVALEVESIASADKTETEPVETENSNSEEEAMGTKIDMSPLIGKRVPKDILDADGSVIVRRGEVLTPRLLEEIKLKNRVTSLI